MKTPAPRTVCPARWISLDLNADHYPTATGLRLEELVIKTLKNDFLIPESLSNFLEMGELVHLWQDSYQKEIFQRDVLVFQGQKRDGEYEPNDSTKR